MLDARVGGGIMRYWMFIVSKGSPHRESLRQALAERVMGSGGPKDVKTISTLSSRNAGISGRDHPTATLTLMQLVDTDRETERERESSL